MRRKRFSGTYAELQGLPDLEKFLALVLSGKDTEVNFYLPRIFFAASLVAGVHCQQQLVRAGDSLARGRIGEAFRLVNWALSYTLLRHKLITHGLYQSLESEAASQVDPTASYLDSNIAELIKTACVNFFGRIGGKPGLQTSLAGKLDARDTRMLHNLRVIQYSSDLNAAMYGRLYSRVTATCREEFASHSQLTEAALALTAHPLAADRESLNAFRGLHQIPEILARGSNYVIGLVSDVKFVQAQSQMLLCLAEFAELAVECLQILFVNLTPRSYHEIRDFLGETSGSQSAELSHRLLRTNLIYLNESNRTHMLRSKFPREVNRILSAWRSWRDLHAIFPLLYLGTTGTKSLIGSADALATVFLMRDSLTGRDGISHSPDVTLDSATDGLEEIVQPLLTKMTQTRFADVQNRTGFFSRSKGSQDGKT